MQMQCEMTELHLCCRISDHTVKPETGSGGRASNQQTRISHREYGGARKISNHREIHQSSE